MEFDFALAAVDSTGRSWIENFERTWPNYKKWYQAPGPSQRPGYRTCLEALKGAMPELLPTYSRLCEWAGGGDLEARFLSCTTPRPS